VKAEHQRQARTLKPLLILKWKRDEIIMNFILGLPKTPTERKFHLGSRRSSHKECSLHSVRPRARTYIQSVIRELHFYQLSHISYFSFSRVVLIEVGLIEGFPQIWKTWISWITQRHYSTQVSFNSHNAQCYFLCTVHLFCVLRKHAYL
jgi:hypothetical protein